MGKRNKKGGRKKHREHRAANSPASSSVPVAAPASVEDFAADASAAEAASVTEHIVDTTVAVAAEEELDHRRMEAEAQVARELAAREQAEQRELEERQRLELEGQRAAEERNRLATLKRHFGAWNIQTKEGIRMRAEEKAAEVSRLEEGVAALKEKREARLSREAIGIWKAFIAARREQHARVDAFVEQRQLKHATKYLEIWRSAARLQAERRAVFDKVEAISGARLMRDSFDQWRVNTERRRSSYPAAAAAAAEADDYSAATTDAYSVSASVQERVAQLNEMLADKLHYWVRQPENKGRVRSAITAAKEAYCSRFRTRDRDPAINEALRTVDARGSLVTLVDLWGSGNWQAKTLTANASLNVVLMEKLLEQFHHDLRRRLKSGLSTNEDGSEFAVLEALDNPGYKIDCRNLYDASRIGAIKKHDQILASQGEVAAEPDVTDYRIDQITKFLAQGLKLWMLDPDNSLKIAMRLASASGEYHATKTGFQSRSKEIKVMEKLCREKRVQPVLAVRGLLASGNWRESGFVAAGLIGCASFNTIAMRHLIENYLEDEMERLRLGDGNARRLVNIYDAVRTNAIDIGAAAEAIYKESQIANITVETLPRLRLDREERVRAEAEERAKLLADEHEAAVIAGPGGARMGGR